LIISKLTRFAQDAEKDIIKTGKVDKDKLYALATDPINVGVDFQKRFVEINLQHVIEMFEDL